jgi:hypothetical protein
MVRKKQKKEGSTKQNNYAGAIDVAAIAAPSLSRPALDLEQLRAALLTSSNLYQQLGRLQQYKGTFRVEERDNPDIPDDDKQLMYKYFLQVLILPKAFPLRQTLRSVLDAIHDSDSPLATSISVAVLNETLLGLPGANEEAIPRIDSVTVMQALIDFRPSRSAFVSDPTGMLKCLAFCSSQLTLFAAPFSNYQGRGILDLDTASVEGEEDTTPIQKGVGALQAELLTSADCCTEILKLSISLLSLPSCQDLAGGVIPALSTLAAASLVILKLSIIHKDLQTQTAMVQVLVLKLLCGYVARTQEEHTPEGLLHLVLHTKISMPSDSTATNGSPALADPLGFARQLIDTKLSATAFLAFCRGCINVLSPRVLLSAPAIEGARKSSDGLFFGPVFAQILRQCAHSDTRVRLYALSGLECWLKRAWSLLSPTSTPDTSSSSSSSTSKFERARFGGATSAPKASAAKAAHTAADTDTQMAESEAAIISTLCLGKGLVEIVDQVSDVILLNWEHPNRKVLRLMPVLFHALLQLQQQCEAEVETEAGASSEGGKGRKRKADSAAEDASGGTIVVLLRRIMEQPAHKKGKYPALALLLQYPRVGARGLLQAEPTLVELLLAAVEDQENVAGAAGSLLLALMTRLGQELEAEHPGSGDSGVKKGGKKQKQKKQKGGGKQEQTQKEAGAVGGEGLVLARVRWVLPLARGLLNRSRRRRTRTAMYALPLLLKLDPLAALPLLVQLRQLRQQRQEGAKEVEDDEGEEDDDEDSQTRQDTKVVFLWALVEVNKHARLHGVAGSMLLRQEEPSGDDMDMTKGEGDLEAKEAAAWVSASEARETVLHFDDELRLSSYEMLCASLRTTTLPTETDFKLLRLFWRTAAKSASPEYRQSVCVSTKKLLWRLRESERVNRKSLKTYWTRTEIVQQQMQMRKEREERQAAGGVVEEEKAVVRKVIKEGDSNKKREKKEREQRVRDMSIEELKKAAGDCDVALDSIQAFRGWLIQSALVGIYPGSPFERAVMAMDLLLLLLATWPGGNSGGAGPGACNGGYGDGDSAATAAPPSHGFSGGGRKRIRYFCWQIFAQAKPHPDQTAEGAQGEEPLDHPLEELWTPAVVLSLLNLLLSSWDRLRAQAHQALLQLPRPLPGLVTAAEMRPVLMWAHALTQSPRQRESDAGALLLKLLHTHRRSSGNGGEGSVFVQQQLAAQGSMFTQQQLTKEMSGSANHGRGAADGAGADGAIAAGAVTAGGGEAILLGELLTELQSRTEQLESVMTAVHQQVVERVSQPQQQGQPNVTEQGGAPLPESLPLLHGLLLAIRYALEATDLSGDGSWQRPLVDRIRTQTTRAFELALTMVADADAVLVDGEAVDFSTTAYESEDEGSKAGEGSDGNKADGKGSSRPGFFGKSLGRNVKGFDGHFNLGQEELMMMSEGNADETIDNNREEEEAATTASTAGGSSAGAQAGRDELASTVQRLVMGSWLTVRECARVLAALVQSTPLPQAGQDAMDTKKGKKKSRRKGSKKEEDAEVSSELAEAGAAAGKENSEYLLRVDEVEGIGWLLLRALLSLKHMGALSAAADAFQSVCEALLHSSTLSSQPPPSSSSASSSAVSHPALCRLPEVWLGYLLRRLGGINAARDAEAAQTSNDGSIAKRANAVQQQRFVLRRSAGLASAFLSLMRAEPRNCAAVLLPTCVQQLLAEGKGVANGDVGVGPSGADEMWRSQVHALNVLKAVFQDARLADDLVVFVSSALVVAVKGFSDPRWQVRNSCMMLFTQVLQRALGNKRVGYTDESAAQNGVTAQQFFACYPMLHPFLLGQLEGTVEDLYSLQQPVAENTSANSRKRKQAQEVPDAGAAAKSVDGGTALYPILLLLSRLRPAFSDTDEHAKQGGDDGDGDAATSTASSLSAAAFAPLASIHASHPQLMVREMAARATSSLVAATSLHSWIEPLVASLPSSAATWATARRSSNNTVGDCTTTNRLHGLLLQLRALLQTLPVHFRECRGSGRQHPLNRFLEESAHKLEQSSGVGADSTSNHMLLLGQLEELLLPALIDRLWLVSEQQRCPPVRSAMVAVLAEVMVHFDMAHTASAGGKKGAKKANKKAKKGENGALASFHSLAMEAITQLVVEGQGVMGQAQSSAANTYGDAPDSMPGAGHLYSEAIALLLREWCTQERVQATGGAADGAHAARLALLLSLVQSPSAALRLAVLRGWTQALEQRWVQPTAPAQQSALVQLHSTLVTHLLHYGPEAGSGVVEDAMGLCLPAALELVVELRRLLDGGDDGGEELVQLPAKLWPVLQDVCRTSKSREVQSHGLALLGAMLGSTLGATLSQLHSSSASSAGKDEAQSALAQSRAVLVGGASMVGSWTEGVRLAAREGQPPMLRLAACRSVCFSQLLVRGQLVWDQLRSMHTNLGSLKKKTKAQEALALELQAQADAMREVLLPVWVLLTQLMQDSDEEVRGETRQLVCESVTQIRSIWMQSSQATQLEQLQQSLGPIVCRTGELGDDGTTTVAAATLASLPLPCALELAFAFITAGFSSREVSDRVSDGSGVLLRQHLRVLHRHGTDAAGLIEAQSELQLNRNLEQGLAVGDGAAGATQAAGGDGAKRDGAKRVQKLSSRMRMVFEKEGDNSHEELAIYVQLAARYLHILAAGVYKGAMKGTMKGAMDAPAGMDVGEDGEGGEDDLTVLRRGRQQFGVIVDNALAALASSAERGLTATAWIGGLSFHRQIFLALHSAILGLMSLLPPVEAATETFGEEERQVLLRIHAAVESLLRQQQQAQQASSDDAPTDRSVQAPPLHPLLCAGLLTLRQRVAAAVGVDIAAGEGGAGDGGSLRHFLLPASDLGGLRGLWG